MPVSVVDSSLSVENHVTQEVLDSVSEYFIHEGEGITETIDYPKFSGRNGTWIFTASSGKRIFVKRIENEVAGEEAFSRSLQFSQYALENPLHVPPSPLLIEAKPNNILIFDVAEGDSLAQLLIEEHLPASFPQEAGKILAKLHSGSTQKLTETKSPSLPVHMFDEAVPAERFFQFSLAEIALWASLQQDEDLIAAVVSLNKTEKTNKITPIHGDLRLDQFHLHHQKLHILDWEEFGLGDPARDLGTLAGELLYRAVLDSVTTRGKSLTLPEEFDVNTANNHLATRMSQIIPQIHRFWTSYLNHATYPIDTELSARTTAYIGWHLIDRTLARAASVPKLPGIERAAAGIGRKILLNPDKYSFTLGIERRDQ